MGYYGNQPATGENNTFRVLDDLTSHTLTFDGSSAGVVSTANSTITAHGHRFLTGQRVTYNDGGGTAIGGLSDGVYYAIRVDKDTFKLANTYAQSIAGTNITLSGLGVGTSHTLNVAFDGVNTKFSATYGSGRRTEITRAAQLTISINGVIQQPVTSKTPTTGFGIDSDGVIVFSTAPSSSDVFWGYASSNNFPTFDISDNDVDSFTANGTDTDFTLSKIPVNNENVLVTIDGVVQYPSDNTTIRAYSVVGNVISFTAIPSVASEIQVRHIGFAGAAGGGGGGGGVTGFYGRTGNVALQSTDSVDVGTVNATSISGTGLTFTTGTIEGNLTVGGVLTYDDVTSVDSLGIITARSTIDAQGNVTVGAGLSVVGVSTLSNVVVGGATTEVVIDGDLRVTGIITTGTGSITLDGPSNNVIVGSGVTIYGNTGIISATSGFKGKLLGVTEIGAIDSSISDTAVDVFVYDTRKDSDNGAWRKRTQHTSWYNETLNTATRGSRREFPAVAVIVAENDTLTIYDGDDPDLPMWMVFNAGNSNGNNMIGRTTENTTCVSILNGLLCVGRSNFGFHMINFVADRARFKENGYDTPYTLPIGTNRNGGNYWLGTNVDGNDLVNDLINDVAMTVLPNAPIDDATGLPIPTIAVATASGLSVITHNGNVLNDNTSAGVSSAGVEACAFSGTKVVYCRGGASGNKAYVQDVSALSTNFTGQRMYRFAYYGETNEVSNVVHGLADIDAVEGSDDNLILGAEEGIAIINENLELPTSGLVAKIASDYNTGWMHGDLKVALLSDTDTTDAAAGSNLIPASSADFSSSSGWNLATGWTISGGKLNKTTTDNNTAYYSVSGLTVGRAYTFSIDVETVGSGTMYFYALGEYTPWPTLTTTGTHKLTVVANSTALAFGITGISGNGAVLDNASVTVGEADRSVHGNGLQVFGTVTKSSVAGSGDTAADLVAYSGFGGTGSADAIRLEQPYTSELDFGTGDWSSTGWFYMTDISQTGFIFDRANVSSGGNRFALYTEGSQLKFFTNDGSTTEEACTLSFGVGGTALNSKWNQYTAIRESTGYMALYLNGELQAEMNGTSRNLTNTSASLVIGHRYNVDGASNAFDGSLSLIRISKTIPSPEQIKKIYEDEKHLFVEKAKATLYGSSNAVTALAYDDDTDLLHVGTSAGRSEFRGLRRINNTTTAVTTAISASDELIAEQ